jgi:pSer/pThr/pTyr-binding forkhead associated (FHA) protein
VWRISALDREGREVAHFEIAQGELTIGRETDRQLVLPSASVSRKHARIVINSGQPSIVDEGSANGVIVDGVRINAPTPIGAANRVEVAEFRLTLESLQPAAPAPAAAAGAATPQAVVAPGGGAALRLVAEGGPYDGRFFDVPGSVGVGRALENDLVFDDPSLSRKHARLAPNPSGRVDVEDLGSSNGTFVNGRKVGRAAAGPGDVITFGDLSFRVEGADVSGTRAVDVAEGGSQAFALVIGGGLTFLVLLFAGVSLLRKPPVVQAPGADAIAKLQKQADQHFRLGRTLYKDRKYSEAKNELDAALELDPANIEARQLRAMTIKGPEDDHAFASAMGSLAIGDRRALENAIRMRDEITDGSAVRAQLTNKLVPALERFGAGRCAARSWSDCAWALCRSYELATKDAPPDPSLAETLQKAEKKLAHDHSYVPCRAAPR